MPNVSRRACLTVLRTYPGRRQTVSTMSRGTKRGPSTSRSCPARRKGSRNVRSSDSKTASTGRPPRRSTVRKTVYQLPVQRRVAAARCTCGWRCAAGGVVLRGHRPLLGAEGLRGVQAHLLHRLRVDPARRREGVAQPGDPGGDGADGVDGDESGERIRPTFPALPAPDAVGGAERGPLRRSAPDDPVAEAQPGPPVRLRLHHELGREAVAVEQVALGQPRSRLPRPAATLGRTPAQVDLETRRRPDGGAGGGVQVAACACGHRTRAQAQGR